MKRSFLYALALIAMAGCGGSSNSSSDVCDKAATVAGNLNTKMAQCQTSVTFDLNSQQCTSKLASCSSADRSTLNTFLDCMNGLPTCTAATETSWNQQADSCATPLNSNLSTACKTAIQ